MRTLTAKQKSMLKIWFDQNYDEGYMWNMALKIDNDTYRKIEEIHPTEIHLQNVNNYLEKLVRKTK